MENQQQTAEHAVIEALAVGKMNLEIENIRLQHKVAELEERISRFDA